MQLDCLFTVSITGVAQAVRFISSLEQSPRLLVADLCIFTAIKHYV